MRKFLLSLTLFSLFTGMLAASDYPPPGGGNLFLFGHPALISSANSAAGGPIFSVGPYSINSNPALAAGLKFPSADIACNVLIDTYDGRPGSALRLGGSLPTRWGVWTAAAQASFVELNSMPIGNTFIGRGGFARDISENLYLGVSLSAGGLWYDDSSDFYFAGDIGIWYRIRQFSFLKNIRFGAALQNLGKTFYKYGPYGVKYDMGFPGFIEPKFGIAANFVETANFTLGLSADVSFPLFSNFIFSSGVQFFIAKLVYVSAGWDFNAREADKDYGIHSPYIGVGVKFSLNTSGNKLMNSHDFNQTDIKADTVWQSLHKHTQLFSVGATANFGTQHIPPPEIKVGNIGYQ
ncbi:MAG: hypothetical protein LBV68_04005 [Spirochaetaceae bacterium]|jgi:hypothetical protein|nr:hypothetical protein [Spirochaetaceae bacterium]